MKRLFICSCTAILLVLPGAGCKKSFSLNEKQAVLFQYDYANNAWGNEHYGYYIDNEGNVLTYTNPEGWHFPDESLVSAEDHVLENLDRCSHSGIKIQDEILKKYSGHILNIAASKVTAAKNTGADIGTTRFLCYQYDEDSGCYKGYLIKMEGDLSSENLNFHSKKVISWMKDIQIRISKE